MTQSAAHTATIYKVATRELFERSNAAGRFLGAPVDLQDGYIHFSTASQLAETLRLHFAGQGDLIVFAVPCAPLGEALRWEASRGGALFPHLYSELPMTLMSDRAPISVSAEGEVTLPEWVK